MILRRILVAAALVAAIYSSVLAYASLLFRRDTAASVSEAVRLVPFDSPYLARLAAWQPEQKVALLHRAVTLNPFEVQAWIQLGLTAEFEQHDPSSAERYFRRAAEVDHMFLPKWTLTNFYFRHQNRTEFLRWAKATLEITPYPPDPVFMQMWLLTQDPVQIARAIPNRAGVLLSYASFLANAHQYQAIAPVVKRLVKAAGTGNPIDYGRDDQIGPAVDRLLTDGELGPALDIWQSMSEAKWVKLPVPTSAHPLNNGNFAALFFGHGFDWAPIPSDGVEILQAPAENNLRVTLSGMQNEHCVLLQQYVPLASNRLYRLRWAAVAENIESPSGLAWHIHPVPNSDENKLAAPDLLQPSATDWKFLSPGSGLCLLTLEYTRPLGTTRASGSVILRSVWLTEE